MISFGYAFIPQNFAAEVALTKAGIIAATANNSISDHTLWPFVQVIPGYCGAKVLESPGSPADLARLCTNHALASAIMVHDHVPWLPWLIQVRLMPLRFIDASGSGGSVSGAIRA